MYVIVIFSAIDGSVLNEFLSLMTIKFHNQYGKDYYNDHSLDFCKIYHCNVYKYY